LIRFLNICVIAALVAAAAYVYKIKFESTRQAERVAKLRMEIRREHDMIAALRAEWSKLDNPTRIQDLAKRHLPLRPVDARQFDKLKGLPERPPDLVPPDAFDPIGVLLDKPEIADLPTGSTSPTKPKTESKAGQPKASEPKALQAKASEPKASQVRASAPKIAPARPPEPKPAQVRAFDPWAAGPFNPPRPSQPVPER
jgi:cell division protein FtsL